MSSTVWLVFAAVLIAVVAITGLTPRGGKPVARTRLMSSARFVLIAGILVCVALGVFGSLKH